MKRKRLNHLLLFINLTIGSIVYASDVFVPQWQNIDKQHFQVLGIKPGMTWQDVELITKQANYIHPDQDRPASTNKSEPDANTKMGFFKLKQIGKITAKQRYEQPLLAYAKENNWINIHYCKLDDKFYIVGIDKLAVVTHENYKALEKQYNQLSATDDYALSDMGELGKTIEQKNSNKFKLRTHYLLNAQKEINPPETRYLFSKSTFYHSDSINEEQCEFNKEYIRTIKN